MDTIHHLLCHALLNHRNRFTVDTLVLAVLALVMGTVVVPTAINVGTSGELPEPLTGYEEWAWPVVGLGLLFLAASTAVELVRSRKPRVGSMTMTNAVRLYRDARMT